MHHSPARTHPRPEDVRRLNLGVLAHVDAGKTSLTEALLHAGGALAHIGRVDDGTTQTDTMAAERRRGITIRTAVATFSLNGVTVNLIDTPGHPDFIAEVDRSLAVLDGAVLVLSAVEGVQAQTIVLYRALRRLGIPAVFLINKIDRAGADPERVVAAVRRRLTDALLPLGAARDAGLTAAVFVPHRWDDPAVADAVTARLADHDDALLAAWVEHGSPNPSHLWTTLRRLTRAGRIHPVLFGSALTGAGVPELITAVTTLLPGDPPDGNADLHAQIFKIDRSPAGGRVCFVRVRTGVLAVRDHVHLGGERVATVTGLQVYEPGGPVRRNRAVAGQIARVHGLDTARIGDRLGSTPSSAPAPAFAPPALETAVVAPGHHLALHTALAEIADIDPLIQLRPDDHHGAVRITVYGEVQQQVIAETLASDYGIEAEFRATTVICVERPAGTGHAVLRMGDSNHRYGATLGLTVEPAGPGSGIELVIAVPRTDIPLHVYSTVDGFHAALLRYLEDPLATGPQGWRVTDIRVTVTENGYIPPGPPPADVRHTAALVVAEAVRRAGTVVCEPFDRFRLETAPATISPVLSLLGRHRAVPDAPRAEGPATVVTGTLPTAEVDAVRRGLHSAAHGEGLFESELDHYEPARTPPRSGRNAPDQATTSSNIRSRIRP